MRFVRGELFLLVLLLGTVPAYAHPVPQRHHDRVITVQFRADAVEIAYHLELDEWTVFADLAVFSDRVDLRDLRGEQVYAAFARLYAPVLADNLTATLDGKPLQFTCAKQSSGLSSLKDSVACDYVFRAPWQPAREKQLKFAFRESNYDLEAGRVQLTLACDSSVRILEKNEPDEALKKRLPLDYKPGDEERLRKVSATFTVPAAAVAAPADTETPPELRSAPPHPSTSLGHLLDSRQGFFVMLLLAAAFGALHALTPGHGKTLVAAYLVGERGTMWHALLLGLTTTLTHTGAVLILAALLYFCPVLLEPVQAGLGLVSGLLVVGLGLWLLFRRLTGRADHFHLGGHGHHHHDRDHDHAHGDHLHDELGHVHPLPAREGPVGWWSMIVLGISGGLVPCLDAIVMLIFAIWTRQLALALPLLLAFSAGLAAVLVAIGMLVVWAKRFAQARLGATAVGSASCGHCRSSARPSSSWSAC